MNEAGVKNFDQESVAGAGLAEKIYGKAKEWGGALKKAGVMFKENPELQKQAITTVAGSLASIAGVKSFYDVPEYLRERFMVRGIFGHGKGVEGSVEDLLAKNWQRREDAGHEPEAEYNIEEQTEVRQAIADLNKRLKLTKEGGQKGSEQRNMIAKLLKEYSLAGKNDRQERKEKITEILDNYTTTKVTGLQAARESLNTFLSASGAMALRGVSYGLLDGAERYVRLNKEARLKAGGQGQAEQVNFLKDVVVGGFKETWNELRLKDESKKKTGLQKGLDFIRASGKVMRYLGLGYSGLHNETLSDNIDNMLYTLEGKTSFSDMEKNFVGNIERTYESYKSMLGRVGHLAKAGGGSVIKGAGAVGQFFVGSPEAVQFPRAGRTDGLVASEPVQADHDNVKTYNFQGTLKGGIYGPGKIISGPKEVDDYFEQLRTNNPQISAQELVMKREAIKTEAQALAVLDNQYNEAIKNNLQEASKIKDQIIIRKNNFENIYGKGIKLNLKSLADGEEKQDIGEAKAERPIGQTVEPKIPPTPFDKGGEEVEAVPMAEHTPDPSLEGKQPVSPSPEGKELVAESYGDKQVNLVPYDDGYYRDQYGNKYGFDAESNSYVPVTEHGLMPNFNLQLGKGEVPAQLERVMHMMAVDAMKVDESQIFGREEMTKSLNVAANLVNLAKGKNVHGLEIENIKEIFSWDGKKHSLAIKDYEKFNDLIKQLHERADNLWQEGKLTGKGAAADYIKDIKTGTWEKIVKAQGLEEAEVAGHKEIERGQIADVEKVKHQAATAEHKSDDERTDKLNREELENVQQARGHIPPEVKTAESAEYNLMENDDWIQEKIGNNINDRLWRKAVGLSDARSVKSPADLAESPRAYSLAEKYSDEKLTLEILDKNNDYQADEVVIKHQGAVVEKYNRLQIEEMFGEENMEKTSLKMEKLAQNLIEDRLRKFEKITDGKVELTRARELGIEIFDQDGLSATDKAKLEFIKDRGFTSDISYEKIKERFKIYDELKGTDIDLKQIDKYYNAVKDIKEPNVSAGLIKVWDEPSDINLQHLLEQLKPQDPKAGFEELTAGKRQNGDLVINYITKGHNEGNYMMVFSAKGQVLLERPGGVIDKIDHISDLKKVLSAPAEMVRGGEEIGTEERLKYNEFTDHQDKTEANGDADNEENSQEPRIRWFTK